MLLIFRQFSRFSSDSAVPHDAGSFPEAWALAFQGFSICLGALKRIDNDCCHFGRLCSGLTSGFRNMSIFVIYDVFATLQWPGYGFSRFLSKHHAFVSLDKKCDF